MRAMLAAFVNTAATMTCFARDYVSIVNRLSSIDVGIRHTTDDRHAVRRFRY